MRIALFQPDIPQNTGNIFRLASCFGINVDIIGPTGFIFDDSFSYIGSLVFLIIFNSVFAFAIYFALINRVGAERSAYVTVLFPVVALVISTIFEDYEWSYLAFVGVGLTLIGNYLVLRGSLVTKSARI